MLTITKDQFNKKWDATPDEIRGALFGVESTDQFWKICEEQKVPEAVAKKLGGLVDIYLLELISIDQFKEEVKNLAGLNPVLAPALGEIINKQLFVPLKSMVHNTFFSTSFVAEPTAVVAATTAPKSAPIIEEIKRVSPASMPAPAVTPAPAPQQPAVPAQKPIAPPAFGGPQIIQRQPSVAPIKPPQGFSIGAPSAPAVAPKQAPVPSARVQLGNVPLPSSQAVSTKSTLNVPRVVHYGELKSVLEKTNVPMPSAPGKAAPVPLSGIGAKPTVAPSTPSKPPLPGIQGVPPVPPPPRQ